METKKAANAAMSSADTARDALRLTEKAEVLIESVEVSTAPNFFPETVVKINFKNFGRTRADDFRPRLWFGVRNRPNELEPTVTFPTAIAPMDAATHEFRKAEDCFSPDLITSIDSGQEVLMFEGTFTYKDIFGGQHAVRCTGVYNRRLGTFSVTQRNGEYTDDQEDGKP